MKTVVLMIIKQNNKSVIR